MSEPAGPRLPDPEVGPRLKAARLGLGYSQQQVANACACWASYIGKLESGQRVTSTVFAERLIKVLRLDEETAGMLLGQATEFAGKSKREKIWELKLREPPAPKIPVIKQARKTGVSPYGVWKCACSPFTPIGYWHTVCPRCKKSPE